VLFFLNINFFVLILEGFKEKNMKKFLTLLLSLVTSQFLVSEAQAKSYRVTYYRPISKHECEINKSRLGLKFCPHDDDFLAGAALACGHINNLPSKEDLQKLAQYVYHTNTKETSIYGSRDDDLMQHMGIWAFDSHIYFWIGEEAKDGVGGYVRMFAVKGSIPYYAPRDGSGYVSHALGKINYGETNVNPENDSNLYGYPNEDVLLTTCFTEDF